MNPTRRSRQIGSAVIVFALLLKLSSLGAAQWVLTRLIQPNTVALLTYLETGRVVRFSASPGRNLLHTAESPGPWQSPEALPVFSSQDAAGIKLYNTTTLQPDVEALMLQPLDWYLPLPEPTVLILHTHTTESYTQTDETYPESGEYRTLDSRYNMLAIGDRVAKILQEHGIAAIHDRTLHDYPSYNNAYSLARREIQQNLARYPTVQLVLDIHRDASGSDQQQLRTLAQVNGTISAQLMMVVGTDATGLQHDQWPDNLSLGLKLQAQLERQAPGITRPISLRTSRFNQDLSPGALLVEVGAAGNTQQEALLAAEQLALAIVTLAKGTGI